MVRRSLGVALWTLVGLLACFLGALASLVETGAGRALLTRVTASALHNVFTGSVEIGDVGGSLLSGLTLYEVRLFDADSTLVAWLPRADVAYNPFDFAAGRIVLFHFALQRPVINIVQHASGRLNIEELLRLGGKPDTGPHGPPTLIVFRNVGITDGSVTLRLQARQPQPGDTALEIASGGPNGRLRVRRFEHLDARLAALQVSSPRERGIRIDVSRLSVDASDPAVRLTDLAGRLRVIGDSMDVRVARVAFPRSVLRDARGAVRWPHDTLRYDLRLHADSATLGDFTFIDRRFAGEPRTGVVSGDVRIRSHGSRVLEVGIDPLRLAEAGGGTVAGRVTALSVADSGLVALRDVDVDARDFDLEFARPFLDTLPFAGRLSGRTVATGPLTALALETDWTFRDSLVPGWPETRIHGKGEVNLKGADGIRFQPFEVESASVDLGTVARLVPAVRLHGTLLVSGTLTGPLKDAQLAGTLLQRDGDRPPSRVTGTVRLDTRGERLGVYATVTADSLSFDGLRGSFPDLPLHGAVTGPVRLAGTLGAIETHVDLRGGGGGSALRADGVMALDLPHYGARDLEVEARDFDLAQWLAGVPRSRLGFMLRGSLTGDSGVAPTGAVRVTLEPSELAGTTLDSGAARVRFADRRLYVDSLRLAQPGLITSGSGSLGWTRDAHGQLALDFDADSLSGIDSLVAWFAGPETSANADPPPDAARPLTGSARVRLTLGGSLDSLDVDARASLERVAWRGWQLPAGRGHLEWHPGSARRFAFDATLDSLAYGPLGFSGAAAAARGTVDSLTWFARSRVGGGGEFLAGGRFVRRTGPPATGTVLAVGVDSLAVHLPDDVWVMQHPTELTVTDSAATVSRLAMQSAYGAGKLLLEGDLPTHGRADAHLQIEAFPLAGVYALLEQDTAGVAGTLTATAGLSGTRAAPVATGSFSLSNAGVSGFHAPFVDGTFEYRDRRLRSAVHLWRSGQQILAVQAYLPLDLALMPVERRQLPDTLSVGATADSVDLSVLEALTPALHNVGGVFSADVGIAGTWDAPRLRGSLQFANAAATIPALNVRYEDVNGRLALSGDTIAIDTLSAKSEGGRADFTGVVRLERLTRPILDLRIAADRFKALDLKNNVTITASGRLALKGPVFGATLTGHAFVTSGVLYFADLVQKRIVNLDELADTSLASIIAQQRLGPEFENVFLDSLQIDNLGLDMGSDVWLRSNEANIQLAGSAHLTKQRNLYLVNGTLQAVRGTYRLKVGPVSREFVVSQGTVRYFGTPDQDAALDIEAKHVVHPVPTVGQPHPTDLTVVAHITGTLLVPKVTLEAEKLDLSQTELISYLLFGKSSVDLSGGDQGIADQAVVQSALAVLSGEIEQTIVSGGVPVDYVEIRPGGGGGQGAPLSSWQLAVGRQLGPKTFLVVNAGFCQGQQVGVRSALGMSLQFRISPEWRTEASFEPQLTCTDFQDPTTVARQVGLDLFWERRY